jgi:hypothetical protein
MLDATNIRDPSSCKSKDAGNSGVAKKNTDRTSKTANVRKPGRRDVSTSRTFQVFISGINHSCKIYFVKRKKIL